MKRSRSGGIRRVAHDAWRVVRPLAYELIRGTGRDLRRSRSLPSRSSRSRSRRANRVNPVKVSYSGGPGVNPKPKRHKIKNRVKPVRTLKQLKKKVNKISRNLNCNNSVFNYFKSDAFSQASAINRCGYGSYEFITAGAINDALGNVPYANIATLATKQEVNVTGTAQPTKWCIKTSAKYCLRNNYLHPVVLDCYVCKPKNATGVLPHVQVANGLTTMATTAGVVTNGTSLYPTHSKLFNDGWKVLRHEKVTLEAGSEIIMAHYETFKNFDNRYLAIYTETYTPKYTRILMVRMQGVCGHDVADATKVGITEAQIDIVLHRKIQIVYPGNFAPLQTIHPVISLDAVADDEVAMQNGIIHDDL